MRNLFVGGKDEGSERFPRGLPQKPKPAAVRKSLLHRRVRRELAGDFADVDVCLEIVFQKFPVRFWMAGGEEEAFCVGKDSDPVILNDAAPLALAAAPAKSLAAAERLSQAVVCGEKLAGLQVVGGFELRRRFCSHAGREGVSFQQAMTLRTGVWRIFSRPFSAISSIRKMASTTGASKFFKRFRAALAVPPVASKSSIKRSWAPGGTASAWMATVLVPYSKS